MNNTFADLFTDPPNTLSADENKRLLQAASRNFNARTKPLEVGKPEIRQIAHETERFRDLVQKIKRGKFTF